MIAERFASAVKAVGKNLIMIVASAADHGQV